MKIRHLIIGITALTCASVNLAMAQNLYVDFENGKDSNSGLSKEAPWQHAPGDSNATSKAARYDLKPGDIINFKGGVEYLGGITISASGTDNQPITFKGNGWGEERALLSGAKRVSVDFKPCQSASDCFDNPNWEKLFKSRLNDYVNPLTPAFLSGERMWIAREPNQPDPFWFDDYEHYNVIGDFGTEMTEESVILGSDLDNTSDKNWDNAIIALWMKPNQVLLTDVMGVDRESGTIYFDPPGNKPYTDRDSYYALFNRPSDVDQPGEYFVDNDEATILIWPENSAAVNQNNLRINSLPAGFTLNGSNNIVIEGFHISHYFGDNKEWHNGTAIINGKEPVRNIVIRDNVIDHLRSVVGVGAIQLDFSQDVLISNNVIANSQKSSGIRFNTASDIILRNNVIDRIGRTGIRLIKTENVQVSDNHLSNIFGIHGNGMSVYLENRNILVANNIFEKVPFAFTYHGTKKVEEANNMWILNNVFLGPIRSWGSYFDKVYYLHNLVFAEWEPKKAMQIPGSEPRTTLKNNIIDGLITKPAPQDWTMSHNIYTALAWSQSPKYGWQMGPNSDLDDGFVSEIENFSEKRPVLDLPKGDNIYSLLPVAQFPQFDFSHWKEPRQIGPTFTAKQ